MSRWYVPEAMPTNLTPRDYEVLSALGKTPLTAQQVHRLSEIFEHGSFPSERRLRQRLLRLSEGPVHRRRLVGADVAGRSTGSPNIYSLSRQGFDLLHGHDAPPPKRSFLQPLAISRQFHTFALAEFLVHTFVAAHRAGFRVNEFYGENMLTLPVGKAKLQPDATFTLATDAGDLHYMVEIDNATEPLLAHSQHAWRRKIELYDALADRTSNRFRVLVLTTRRSQRLDHILDLASRLMKNPARVLFVGCHLPDFLANVRPLHAACFRDHRQAALPLVLERHAIGELAVQLVAQPALC